ncbi:hypothetical protein AB0L53_58580 [Nonomuraea sp. NPDC052129]|uniref:hypothetical protein n=1 Tax=Nonomuraea sp. NPDC052129 TaxID=3154651 RepID=UPI00341A2DFF
MPCSSARYTELPGSVRLRGDAGVSEIVASGPARARGAVVSGRVPTPGAGAGGSQ